MAIPLPGSGGSVGSRVLLPDRDLGRIGDEEADAGGGRALQGPASREEGEDCRNRLSRETPLSRQLPAHRQNQAATAAASRSAEQNAQRLARTGILLKHRGQSFISGSGAGAGSNRALNLT